MGGMGRREGKKEKKNKEVKEWEEKEGKTSGGICTRNELFKK